MVISSSPLDSFRKCIALFMDPALPQAVSMRTCAAGATLQYTLGNASRHMLLAFGTQSNDVGLYMIAHGSNYSVVKAVSAASNVSITHSGNTYTITNNSTRQIPIYIISVIGTCTEV